MTKRVRVSKCEWSKWHKAKDGTNIRTCVKEGPRGGIVRITELKRGKEHRRIMW